ncbi:MAG: SusD/RagB family nutrient-binding outer membrane lipoprotein, partial [Alistipes sp.]|nr:SusD/RagB family nutrient-binding outer membrane lipoprotein [Alistipes sp.]
MIKFKATHIFFVLLLGLYAVAACTGNFEDKNRDPYGVTDEEKQRDNYAIGSAFRGLLNYVIPTQVHLNQFQEVLSGCAFAGYYASTPEWTARFATYNPPIDWLKAPYNDVITNVYANYDALFGVTDDPVVLSLARLLRVASMHRVTDAYGPIPYTTMDVELGEDEESNTLTSPYDSQETVYRAMFDELDDIIESLTENISMSSDNYRLFDDVYSGDVEKWIKFANSLKLRMAMRLVYASPTLTESMAREAVSHPVGVMTANQDNAMLTVNVNPYYTQITEWGDERAAADITSYMNGYSDPRRDKYFAISKFVDDNGNADPSITPGYWGLRSGVDIASKDAAEMYSSPLVAISDRVMWMNAAEMWFLRAEGALRGWSGMGGTAEDLYNTGIQLSFEQHGAGSASDYINDATSRPADYIDPKGNTAYNAGARSNITIKWDDTDTFERNLERIITQKWIANYPLGNEAWSEYRRTGYPQLMFVVNNKSGGVIADNSFIKRLPYPNSEYTENRENVIEAIN